MYFCSVALQSEFRRRWEFHHVIGVYTHAVVHILLHAGPKNDLRYCLVRKNVALPVYGGE